MKYNQYGSKFRHELVLALSLYILVNRHSVESEGSVLAYPIRPERGNRFRMVHEEAF